MQDFLLQYYLWIKALHVIGVISWMAGMLYLPRLFVYHVEAAKGSDKSETFKVMEKKLLRIIMTPAMIAAWVFGILMIAANPELMKEGWLHVKLAGVFVMSGLHGFFAATVKKFSKDENNRPAKFYRMINEIPAVLMIIAVIMVIARPF